ncbi:MAG: ATP-binding cassette domain-containing protein [Firmicutes bacterium]|nr:ATP-binding cassette domain-containing protein [Bacillota bacterium]
MITVSNVSKTYKNKNTKKLVVDNISFDIKQGEIVGYIGKNGAGKSTTIKMLCGILYPDKGCISIDGISPQKNRLKSNLNIGVIFGQRTQLWWDLPLKDSFRILKAIYKVSDIEFNERLEYFDEIFQIKSLLSATVRTLSLGERMKADIVASLIHNPKVLFMDEPTIGLDVYSKVKMREAIQKINQKYNTTIMITTHDFRDVEELCERVIILDKGKIIYDNNIHKFTKKYSDEKKVIISIENQIQMMHLINSLQNKINDIDINFDDKNSFIIITYKKEKKKLMRILNLINENGDLPDFTVVDKPLENMIEDLYRMEHK